MAVVSMKQFLEAGVHFGHQTKRWNPKMRPYIFGSRNGIHIIDLQKTLRQLKIAHEYVRNLSARGESVLFVGTKHQAKDIMKEEALRSNSFFINERWLGGLLTNFNTIKASIGKMRQYEEMRGENGLYDGIIKKEAMKLDKKLFKLDRALGGIKDMRRMPGAIFVVDCKKEKIALTEAQKLGIPIVAVVDTNCDPDQIDHVIPGNDDAIRAIRLFSMTIADAVLEGRAMYEARMRTETKEEKPAKRASKAVGTPAGETLPGTESQEAALAEPVAEAAPAEAAPAEAAAEPVVEAAPAEAAAEPVVEAAPAQAAAEPVVEAAPVEASVEPVAEAVPVEAAAEPVVEAAPAEPVAEAAPAEAAEEPKTETTPVE